VPNYKQLTEFENALGEYTGAPYVVLTSRCTHAIELCMRLNNVKHVTMPKHTYVSALMVCHIVGATVEFNNKTWDYEYCYEGTNIWDSARAFDQNMYRSGQMQCLSFGASKRLELMAGGAILLDNEQQYKDLKRMAFDGRDLDIAPWQNQTDWKVGYHYNMVLEDAVRGTKMLKLRELKSKQSQLVEYPDVSLLDIQL
jgi:dTDP-4-amino-4,6-dideoxygalactose transaminase